MTKSSNFISNSDFASFKNDDSDSIVLTIPANISILSGKTYSQQVTINIGTSGAILKYGIEYPLYPGKWFMNGMLNITLNDASSPAGGSYSIRVYVTKISGSSAVATAYIFNDQPSTIVTGPTPKVINIKLFSFLSPFA